MANEPIILNVYDMLMVNISSQARDQERKSRNCRDEATAEVMRVVTHTAGSSTPSQMFTPSNDQWQQRALTEMQPGRGLGGPHGGTERASVTVGIM
ncbi:hypothetical protein NQZ68_003217 [Dissostichus eleginoides]|nr:hypothetical protein NQZ68_003217 [Dissostichus eleginoides]